MLARNNGGGTTWQSLQFTPNNSVAPSSTFTLLPGVVHTFAMAFNGTLYQWIVDGVVRRTAPADGPYDPGPNAVQFSIGFTTPPGTVAVFTLQRLTLAQHA